MSIEQKTIDLLTWIKERGFGPKYPKPTDRCLCPITNRLSTYGQLRPHQRRIALWIPTVEGLTQAGIAVTKTSFGKLLMVQTDRFSGFGPGESEAVLSLLNRVRTAQAA